MSLSLAERLMAFLRPQPKVGEYLHLPAAWKIRYPRFTIVSIPESINGNMLVKVDYAEGQPREDYQGITWTMRMTPRIAHCLYRALDRKKSTNVADLIGVQLEIRRRGPSYPGEYVVHFPDEE